MLLTKSDFLQYLNCPENLWLQKHKPDLCPIEELSEYDKKLIDDGYHVELIAQQLYPHAKQDVSQDKIMGDDASVFFQTSFRTESLFARVDILERTNEGKWNIIEVKSSTSTKKDHEYDLAFQKYVLQACGFEVDSTYILHCNKEYVRKGDLELESLFVMNRMNDKVAEKLPEVSIKIAEAVKFLSKGTIDENKCSCLYKSKGNHCASFDYFNKQIPEYSIYQLSRIRSERIAQFLFDGIIELRDVDESNLSGRQQLEVISLKKDEPLINLPAIQKQLSKLEFPLYFYDYETYADPIPFIDGLRPHQQLVFQVSIHRLFEDGHVDHAEYLADEAAHPSDLVRFMHKTTGMAGTFIVWNKSFENTRNKEMAYQIPEYAVYLKFIIDHTFDLMDVFKENYVDYRSKGSISIKKILPLLCPHLSYASLSIQEGTAAQEGWRKMVFEDLSEGERFELKKSLLEYCKLDTWAMVEIYQVLKKLG